jgi:hypothetical protein
MSDNLIKISALGYTLLPVACAATDSVMYLVVTVYAMRVSVLIPAVELWTRSAVGLGRRSGDRGVGFTGFQPALAR